MNSEKKTKKKKNGRIKSFFADFKAFISKGNILDLAIAVVIGAAFGKIVSSLVNDIIMPLITLIAGGKSVKDWKWVIKSAEIKDGVEVVAENALRYGNFLQSVIDFLIIAIFIFLALRIYVRIKKRLTTIKEQALPKSAEEAQEQQVEQVVIDAVAEQQANGQTPAALEAGDKLSVESILLEIRDLLKNNNSDNSDG